MATGLVAVEYGWHHSIARPRKLPVRRKYLRDVSYTSRVIADFVPNFVAMATGVGRGRICMASYGNGVGRGRIWLASFNSLTPKNPCYTQTSQRYLLYKPSYSRWRHCNHCECPGNYEEFAVKRIQVSLEDLLCEYFHLILSQVSHKCILLKL